MRLIDADDAVNIFTNRLFETLKTQIPCVTAEENQICLDTCYKVAKYEVDNIPTAYDVERVAGEIEDVLWNCYIDNGQGFKTYVNRACEILRKGGKE